MSKSGTSEKPSSALAGKFPITTTVMIVSGILACGLALAAPWAMASQSQVPVGDHGSSSPSETFVVGTDGPADRETQGYFINHVGLNTHNLTRIKAFYGDVLGMRHMFTLHLTPEYTVSYLGWAQGGRNGTGFQSGTELTANKNNLAGLLEFTQFTSSDVELTPATRRTGNFGHIGLIVPDLQATQARVERYGAKIVKRAGEPAAGGGEIAQAYNMASGGSEDEIEAVVQMQAAIGFDKLFLFEDPDGNLVEVQQLYMPGVL